MKCFICNNNFNTYPYQSKYACRKCIEKGNVCSLEEVNNEVSKWKASVKEAILKGINVVENISLITSSPFNNYHETIRQLKGIQNETI